MSSKDYKKAILDGLLKKYNNRYAKNITTNRRIILKPIEVYKDYAKNNADISEKQGINEAVSVLTSMGFVTADYLKFSDDIEKIYLSEEKLNAVYEYLKDEYGVVPQSTISKQMHEIVEKYICTGEIVQNYCESILTQIEDPRCLLVPEKIEANLKMLSFLEKNKENLYVREASMLVYGDSKWFENNNYEEICTFMRTVTGRIKVEGERNDAILSFFYVTPTEQEIFIKGNWRIEWEQYALDISKFQGGIAIASGDVQSIKSISVNTESIMTIENKTSFQRLRDGKFAMMYLGGFANRHQIEFLKKVIPDNPNIRYYHFGDIDIGGFLIHKHLCRETSKRFELYCMGIKQLCDMRFSHCLKSLTDNDMSRFGTLMEEGSYSEVLKYMKENSVKLEQEIVSYYLVKDTSTQSGRNEKSQC
ncbi:MAG: DUF2220 domain-containing protein [Lachnospiraceae bacterium]|nr:DUF2220 domain-containing protein [Lachnospiraceae bacterium]